MSRYDKFSGATSAKSMIFEKNEENQKCIILTFFTKKSHFRSVLIKIEKILSKNAKISNFEDFRFFKGFAAKSYNIWIKN
jgi:hypothetical protein